MSLAICVIEQVGAGFQYVLDTRVSKSPLSWNVHSVQLSGLADSEQTPPRDIVSLGATKGDSTGNFQQEPGNANARQRMTYADGQHAGAERQGFEPWVPLRVLRFSRPECNFCNSLSDIDLQHGRSDGCTNGCRSLLPDDLMQVVRSWEKLPEHIRTTICHLCSVADADDRLEG